MIGSPLVGARIRTGNSTAAVTGNGARQVRHRKVRHGAMRTTSATRPWRTQTRASGKRVSDIQKTGRAGRRQTNNIPVPGREILARPSRLNGLESATGTIAAEADPKRTAAVGNACQTDPRVIAATPARTSSNFNPRPGQALPRILPGEGLAGSAIRARRPS